MSEDWPGMGRMSIEGAAKYGHIRNDLRKRSLEGNPNLVAEKPSRLHNFAKKVLEVSGIRVIFAPRPEEE